MATPLAIVVFLASAAVTLGAAAFFADRLDHVGPRLGLPEAVVGLVTALAADAPELSSAVAALARGEKQASLGVVLGSNVFNLAAMVGLTAFVCGAVRLRRDALALEGGVALLTTLVAALLLVGVLPAWLAVLLFAAVLVPYLLAVGRASDGHGRARHEGPLWKPLAQIVPAVALIVVGATGMVRAALDLAHRWHVSQTIVGIFVLAVLTSLPNAFTAVRLGRAGRGAALVTETLASNTINLAGGVLLPALVAGLAASTRLVQADLVWVGGMTVVAIALLAPRRGVSARGGLLLVALYAAFVTVQLAYG
ncbi:MAG: hypothetical protein JO017_01085 [Actinobacteria bacterium]|nr:hypothetical protein [Actinomycetota bacterium]